MSLPIRVRLTLATTASVALIVLLGAIIFANQVREGLIGGADADLKVRAAPLADAMRQTAHQNRVPTPQDLLLQVFDAKGDLAESSPSLEGRALLSAEQRRAARDSSHFFTVRLRDDTRVLALPIRRPEGIWVLVVGSSLRPQYNLIADVTGDLVLGAVLITLVGALGAWLLAGAALRPVERMRQEAALISERDPASSLNVPRTSDEVAALATTMNALLARLREGMLRERRLVANAAHELRTPLAILCTELELAGRPGRSREELADAVANSTLEVNRLVQLADNLLLLARADEGVAIDIRPGERIHPLLEQAARLAAPAANAKGIRLVVEVMPGLIAEIDPGGIRQAVDNLLSNALRHTLPGSEVRLSAREDSGRLVIEVADEGPGFPAEFLPHAFERFRRADAGRAREQGGSGLGLAVVRAIARAHGGEATASNREGGGALVRMAIPRRRG